MINRSKNRPQKINSFINVNRLEEVKILIREFVFHFDVKRNRLFC